MKQIVTFKALTEIVFKPLAERIEKEAALGIFARERSKFEGWLKVNVCSVLLEAGLANIIPEQDRIDVKCDGWAIELKTLNTNYRYPNATNKHRPITKNVQGVIDDIEALRNSTNLNGINKAVLFVVFPVLHEKPHWQGHLAKIKISLGSEVAHCRFTFSNDINGVIYLGQVI